MAVSFAPGGPAFHGAEARTEPDVRTFLDSIPIPSVDSMSIELLFSADFDTLAGHMLLRTNSAGNENLFLLYERYTIEYISVGDLRVPFTENPAYSALPAQSKAYAFRLPYTPDLNRSGPISIEIGYYGATPRDSILSGAAPPGIEFREPFHWFPCFLGGYRARTSARIYNAFRISIPFTFEGTQLLNRDDNSIELAWKNPVKNPGMILGPQLRTDRRNYSDGGRIVIKHKNAGRRILDELYNGVEFIMGRLRTLLGAPPLPPEIELILLPRRGSMYPSGNTQVILPAENIVYPLYEWAEYQEAFYQCARVCAGYWWARCPVEWMRESFSEYAALQVLERMFGYESIIARSGIMEQAFRQSLDGFENLAARNRIESLCRYKFPFALRMLDHQLGGEGMESRMGNIMKVLVAAGVSADYNLFRKQVFQESGKDFGIFFRQWFESLSIPGMICNYKVYASGTDKFRISVSIDQGGETNFEFPMDFTIVMKDESVRQRIYVPLSPYTFSFTMSELPLSLIFDPENYILDR